MSEDYNSILKEKKVYKDPVVEKKYPLFKRFLKIGFLISLIIIVISYVIYYNTILESESIFLNNVIRLLDYYGGFYDKLSFDYDLSHNYTLDGLIMIDDKTIWYNFIKDNNKIKRVLKKDNNSIFYYRDNDFYYIGLSNLGNNYIEKNGDLYSIDYYYEQIDLVKDNFYNYIVDFLLNDTGNELFDKYYNIDNYELIFDEVKNNYSNIDSSKYIKKFYFENKKPIVEVSLVLDTGDINKILKNSNLQIEDNVKVIITMKNDAIMNDIQDIKVIINNKSKNMRDVIYYKDKEIIYTDNSGLNNKLVFVLKDDDIALKYYKNDVLYSVLSGTSDNGKYIYTYQVIDYVYNISLTVDKNSNSYSYLLESNIDNNVSKLLIEGTYINNGVILEDVSNSIKYDDLTDVQKSFFDGSIKNLLFGY